LNIINFYFLLLELENSFTVFISIFIININIFSHKHLTFYQLFNSYGYYNYTQISANKTLMNYYTPNKAVKKILHHTYQNRMTQSVQLILKH